MHSEQIGILNKKLKDMYGLDISVSKPRFRIVWSSCEYEVRVNFDGFDIYNDEGIFLRTEFGSKEVEKYPLHQDMWVLEELVDSIGQPGLIQNKWSYEPKWFFGQGGSNPIPIWRAVDLLCKAVIFAKDKPLDSYQTMIDNEEVKMAKEKILFKEILKDNGPFMGESQVSVPGEIFVKEE